MTWKRLALVLAAALLVAYGTMPTVGGRTFFSPDTLETRSQLESPFVWRGYTYHRYPLVDFLFARGYWSPASTDLPRWVLTSHWNRSWRDGQSALHSELAWRSAAWIEWTDAHPELAAVVWPRVLQVLREDDARSQNRAAGMLLLARHVKDGNEFQAELARLMADGDW